MKGDVASNVDAASSIRSFMSNTKMIGVHSREREKLPEISKCKSITRFLHHNSSL